MKIAITGASGQFGREATRLLIEAGVAPDDLILVTRSPEKLARLAGEGASVRRGDFDDEAGMAEALRGGERMLMISGTRVGYREPQHRAAIDAARKAGVRHVVYTSFIGSTENNPSIAVKDHIATERMLRESGLDWTALRDAQYAEAVVEAMAPLVIGSGRMLSVAGDGRMGFVSRNDCVASAVAVLTGSGHVGRTYNLTGPEALSYREVAGLLQSVSGRPVEFVVTDEEGLYAMFDAMGVPRQPVEGLTVSDVPWNSDDMVSFEVAVRDRHFDVLSNDVERLTGRVPVSLAELLRRDRETILAKADAFALAMTGGEEGARVAAD